MCERVEMLTRDGDVVSIIGSARSEDAVLLAIAEETRAGCSVTLTRDEAIELADALSRQATADHGDAT